MARVVALLAQGPGFPEGDVERGLEISPCLTPLAQIDLVAFEADPLPHRVRRFWPDREDWSGELIRVDEGWAIVGGADEPLWNCQINVVRPGEYITLRRPSGEELIFRIVSVEQD